MSDLSSQVTYGSTYLSWKGIQPRAILNKLLNENPEATEETLIKLLIAEAGIQKPSQLTEAIFTYFAHNSLHSRQRQQSKKTELKPAEQARAIIASLTLPNGLLILNATGADCIKAGSWFAEVGKRVGKTNLVKDKLTVSELHNLWTSHAHTNR